MFIQSFLIVITLIVLIVFGTVFYAVFMLVKSIIKKKKIEKHENEIVKIAESIKFYRDNKNINNIDELKTKIDFPKNMEVLYESDDIIIKFVNLTYSVNKERFLVSV